MSAGDRSPSTYHELEAQTAELRDTIHQEEARKEEEQHLLKRKAPSPTIATEEAAASKRPRLGENPDSQEDTKRSKGNEVVNDAKLPEEASDSSINQPRRQSQSYANGTGDETNGQSAHAPDRRRGFSQEEKKRGQRLFGGLLSTLSQTTANSHQKKRLEIERRQQERATKQKIEDDKRRADRLAKLDEIRRIEQVKFDEQVMHTRHSTMLAKARSLRTESEPYIFYRPWDLTPEQERTIKAQVQDAEDAIEREVRDFRRRKETRLKELGVPFQPSPPDASPAGEPVLERSNPTPAEPPSRPATAKSTHDKDHDERDIMVETEEDTVIY